MSAGSLMKNILTNLLSLLAAYFYLLTVLKKILHIIHVLREEYCRQHDNYSLHARFVGK